MITKLQSEIERRLKDTDTLLAIIGPEMRLRRTMMKKTLKFVSYRICSISYISKIESNDIKPNKDYLNEIGKRLDMSEDQLDGLVELREVLNTGIREFLFNKDSYVSFILKNKSEYVNYRYKLLVLLNDLNHNNIIEAEKNYSELTKISKSMTEYDFKIFVILSAIYLFKCGEISEAYNILLLISNMELSENLRYILNLYLFYCLSILGRVETIDYYHKTRNDLISIGSYELLDDINYNLALFYIKSGSYRYASNLLDSIKNTKRKNTIRLLINYFSDEPINYFNINELLPLGKIVYCNKHDRDNLKKEVENAKSEEYRIDYFEDIFNYLLVEDDAKIKYLLAKGKSIIKNSEDLFVKKYFLKEIYKICQNCNKYRFLFDMCNSYYEGEFI